MIKTVIGIISYNDKHYLEQTLPVLSELKDCKIIILDNAANDEIQKFVAHKFPDIEFIRHRDGNLGFGRGHNYILLKSPPSHYYFCLNSDILIKPEGFNACIKHLDDHHDCCMVSAKLYSWDFHNNQKTNIIDTFGILGTRAHHFWDRGQGKIDKGQYDNSINNVFGISGAAFFIRPDCIEKIHGSTNQLFDENFFMYKEDIDLSYRMRWLDMRIDFLKDVLGYHDRTVGKNRKKSDFEARASYKNHLILLRNHLKGMGFGVWFHTLLYEKIKFFYHLLKNPKVLKELPKAFKVKIHKPMRKISPNKMLKYLLK